MSVPCIRLEDGHLMSRIGGKKVDHADPLDRLCLRRWVADRGLLANIRSKRES